jgi:hypothetical protein
VRGCDPKANLPPVFPPKGAPVSMSLKEHLKSARAAVEDKKYDSLKIICENGLGLDPNNVQLLMYHGLACAHVAAVRCLADLWFLPWCCTMRISGLCVVKRTCSTVRPRPVLRLSSVCNQRIWTPARGCWMCTSATGIGTAPSMSCKNASKFSPQAGACIGVLPVWR